MLKKNSQLDNSASEFNSTNSIKKLLTHPKFSKLKSILMSGAFLASVWQLYSQDIKKTIDSQQQTTSKYDWLSERFKELRSSVQLIKDLDKDLKLWWYEDTLKMAQELVSNMEINEIQTRSIHNIHISFRLPADVNLWTTYIPTLVSNINTILNTHYNPLPWEDYQISWYDIQQLPPNYNVPRYGNVDLTFAGNTTSDQMIENLTIVKDDIWENCLVTLVVPVSASWYYPWYAWRWYDNNNNTRTNLLNTTFAVAVMKSGSNSEILLSAWTWIHEVLWHLIWNYYPWWLDDGSHTFESCSGNDYMNPSTWNQICSTSQSNIAADLWPDGWWDVEECTTYPLPLHLLNFGWESIDETTNKLHRIVSQEKDISWYEIENSIDGKQWMQVWYQSAINSPHQHSYNLVHDNAPVSSYYRIKSIGIDNREEYIGNIIHISKKWKQSLLAYPNPTSGSIHVELIWTDGRTTKLEVYNMLWQKVHDQDLMWSKTDIDLSNLPDGMYNIQSSINDGTTHSQKIIKN